MDLLGCLLGDWCCVVWVEKTLQKNWLFCGPTCETALMIKNMQEKSQFIVKMTHILACVDISAISFAMRPRSTGYRCGCFSASSVELS